MSTYFVFSHAFFNGKQMVISFSFLSCLVHITVQCFVNLIIISYQQEALKALWHAAFPNIALKGLISEQWKEMGWQGPNPSTDFR
jgi:hypothetical protein